MVDNEYSRLRFLFIRARDERESNQKLGLVPGMDPDDAPGLKAKPKSENQRKNENRKKKKEAAAKDSSEDSDDDRPAASLSKAPAPAPKAPEAAAVDPKQALIKKIGYHKVRMQDIDELLSKDPASLNQAQKDKILRRPTIDKELAEMEAQLAAM
mmetsp:Transcript_31488/g.84297  ORF Transcript_31488/g.84297 Transcript_31488/m.84297 type:complete len:155 (+) Transcript_31488:191-655(+)